jgi:hypothetical protein
VKNSRKLTWVLLILALGIWGIIGFKIYDSTSTTEEFDLAMKVPRDIAGKREIDRYIYVNDVRDPFRYTEPFRKDTTRKSEAQKPAWMPPPLKLTGILLANKQRTAMLEGNNGSVFFVHEGDTLSGTRVLKISGNSVTYLYQKKKTEWVLNNTQN